MPMDQHISSAESLGSGQVSPLVAQYDSLRQRLMELHAAPVRDMVAIDHVMAELDETHAAFKAQHSSGLDHQRY